MARVPIAHWLRFTLAAAGLYNVAWGSAVILAPEAMYRASGLATQEQPLVNVAVWQCLGMVIGGYGLGYWIARNDPVRHWPIVFVGLVGKVCGPIGFVAGALSGRLPWTAGIMIVFNDLVWWAPFTLILRRAWTAYRDDENAGPVESVETALMKFPTQHGPTLADLSKSSPVLLIFLRHLG